MEDLRKLADVTKRLADRNRSSARKSAPVFELLDILPAPRVAEQNTVPVSNILQAPRVADKSPVSRAPSMKPHVIPNDALPGVKSHEDVRLRVIRVDKALEQVAAEITCEISLS